MFERFDEGARRVLVLAKEEARLLDHDYIGTEHLLVGLIGEGDGVAAEVLRSFDVAIEVVRAKVAAASGASATPYGGSPPFTPRAKKVLELSRCEAADLGDAHIGSEHLLLGLLREGQGLAAQVLVALAGSLIAVRQEVGRVLAGGLWLCGLDASGVVPTDAPLRAAELFPPDDAAALLAVELVAEVTTHRTEQADVEYDTCLYQALPLPEISVSVAAARVSQAAFDSSGGPSAKAQRVEGLGDAATYSAARQTLRVLVGTTLFVVKVSAHRRPRTVAMAVARRVLANLEDGDPVGR